MTVPRGKLVLSLVTVALAALLYVGYRNLEWEEQEIDLGFTPAARHDPFLAAERFLAGQHISTRSATGFGELDALPPGATLIVAGARSGLSRERLEQLWAWVERGGHLVVTPTEFSGLRGQQDPILQRLHATLHPAAKVRNRSALPGPRFDVVGGMMASDCKDDPNLEISMEGEDRPYKVGLRSGTALSDDAKNAVAGAKNEEGYQLLQFAVGDGAVFVFSDLSMWGNARIGCHDHAALLAGWVNGSGAVWFAYNPELPSLMTLIWQQQRPLVVALALCLALGLWRGSRRFGPLVEVNRQVRRSLREHLHAGALFLWRQRRYDALLHSLQKAVEQAAERRHPGLGALEPGPRSAAIAAMARMDKQPVHHALYRRRCEDAEDFTDLIRTLQTIRNAL